MSLSYKYLFSSGSSSSSYNNNVDPKQKKTDMYGQVQVTETPELIEKSLSQLEAKLETLPSSKKVMWERAKKICPNQTGNDHRLMFLRCEVFNVDLAATRLVKYWDNRIETFGTKRGFLPLTLNEALRDDESTLLNLSSDFITTTNTTDPSGRSIIFMNTGKRPLSSEGYKQKSMLRAIWYVMHAALFDSEMAQKRGVIFLAYCRGGSGNQFDPNMVYKIGSSVRGCLPIRISRLYICHPPSLAAKVVFPVMKVALGETLGNRLKVMYGRDEEVTDGLGEFGLKREIIPTQLGGEVVLNKKKWLEDRASSGR